MSTGTVQHTYVKSKGLLYMYCTVNSIHEDSHAEPKTNVQYYTGKTCQQQESTAGHTLNITATL
jgi:hypothetical protein